MSYRILCVNPGSTSTKIAVFDGADGELEEVFRENIQHSAEDLAGFSCNNDQIPYRTELILRALDEHGMTLDDMDAFGSRGGGQCSHVGGTYVVNERMAREAHDEVYASHPALLACQICYNFSLQTGRPAYMTNSPATDEMRQIARITGMKGCYRICYAHALNQKEAAQRYARSIGRPYEDLDLVVCHVGGGVSVTAHRHGRMVDTNDILNGDGPMAPNRTGSLPAQALVDRCFDAMERGEGRRDVSRYVRSKGGLYDLLGTFDAREVRGRIDDGDVYAKNVYDAMCYQIAKYVGSMYVALGCRCDAIILTGGIAHDDYLCGRVEEMTGSLAPVVRMPGEFEMEALAHGALSALEDGIAMEYTGVPVWDESKLHEECESWMPGGREARAASTGEKAVARVA